MIGVEILTSDVVLRVLVKAIGEEVVKWRYWEMNGGRNNKNKQLGCSSNGSYNTEKNIRIIFSVWARGFFVLMCFGKMDRIIWSACEGLSRGLYLWSLPPRPLRVSFIFIPL